MKTLVDSRQLPERSACQQRFGRWLVTSTTRISLLFVVLYCVLFPLSAAAQTKTIEIEQSGMQPTVRVGCPILSWWDVKIKGSALMEGQLEFKIFSDRQLLATTVTEDLALAGPQQRVRVMLPPVDDSFLPIEQLRIEARFLSGRQSLNLGTHLLRVAMVRSKTFMVLVPTSRVAPRQSSARERVVRRLAFESMASTDLAENASTILVSLEPNDLPQEPMAYCGFEMVVLFGDEFRLLKKPHLDALLAWVRAGGSLYLEPAGVLETYHIDFLRKLTSSDPRSLIFQPDSHGRLIPGTIYEEERVLLVPCSLGRAVVRVEEEHPDESLETAHWRQATGFLWRLRAEQLQAVGKSETNRLGDLLPNGWYPSFDGTGGVIHNVSPAEFVGQVFPPGVVPAQNGNQQMPSHGMLSGWLNGKLRTSTMELVNRLMPDGVKMVPLWVLGLILTTFVIWIGPVDYFVLGRFKARKYTWLTFPLATVLVTAFTVWITNRYMSSAETRRALVVLDIGDDGAVVRTNRFELLFVASSRSVTTEVRKGVLTPLEIGNSMADDGLVYTAQMYRRGANPYQYTPVPNGDRTSTQMSGRIPTEFRVSQGLAKWTPQLNRVFSIPGPKDEATVDWNSLIVDISADQMFTSHSIPLELQSRVKDALGSGAMVACLGSQGRWACDSAAGWRSNQADFQSQSTQMYNQAQLAQIYRNGQFNFNNISLPQNVQQQPDLFRWMYQHSMAMPQGLFGMVTSIGPNGGPNMNDLPILDTSDARQILLIVVVPRGDDFIAYRKLIRLKESGNPKQ